MNAIILLAQGGEGQVAEIARTFGVDWVHLGAQIISFGIVCAVLYKFAYRRVLAMLDERSRQIAQGLANAERIKAELDRTETQRREVLAQAHAQGAQFIDEARATAARVLDQETQKAIATAEEILTKAREASAQDHDRMLAELRREVGRLVVQTTMLVAGKVLTTEDQQHLAEEAARQLAA
jgi:F-type H+-transporting ATPase subunit b